MDQVTISLQAPVSPGPMQSWVQEQVDRLRLDGLGGGILLGRLVRAGSGQAGDWLVAVGMRARAEPLEADTALARILAELHRLGLRPALLVASGRAAAPVRARRPSHPRSRVSTRPRPRARRTGQG